jgi:hypothetical protein
MTENKVDEPGVAYLSLAKTGRWQTLEDLWGGTPTMREARQRQLPRFDKEADADYEARLNLNSLYPMWKRTAGRLVSKPYAKPVTWDEGLPENLEAFLLDVDGAGTTLTQFSRAWFLDGVRWGMGHALVDFTPVELNLGGAQAATRGEEEAAGARPAAVRIAPPNLIDWLFERRDGEDVLVEIRYRGERTVRDGFKQESVKTITHYTDTFVQEYTSKDGGQYEPQAQIPHTFGRVPLVTWYANRTGIMEAEPPLLELAEKNTHHWQISADYNVGLYLASQDRFFVAGLTEAEKAQVGLHSMKQAILIGNPQAKVAWVSNEGKGLAPLENALQKIEDQGEALSARPTSRDRSPVTATGEIRGEQDATCDLQAWVNSQDDGLLRVLQVAAEWMGAENEIPDDFGFSVNRSFTIGPESSTEIDQIARDAKEGRITNTRYLEEAKRRGLYSDDLDPEEEAGAADQEATERGLALLGEEGGEDPPPQGDEAA